MGTVPIFVGLTMDDKKKNAPEFRCWTAINVFIILVISFFSANMFYRSLELVQKHFALQGYYYCHFRVSFITYREFQQEKEGKIKKYRVMHKRMILP
jgi:hypothetical protein